MRIKLFDSLVWYAHDVGWNETHKMNCEKKEKK